MKVYINRKPIRGPYGGGNMLVKAAYEHLPEFGMDVIAADNGDEAPDVMLCVAGDSDGVGISVEQAIMYRHMMQDQRKVKLVLRVNENDARKGTTYVDDGLIKLSQYVDGTIFVSEWLKEYFEKDWVCKNNTVIINGCDSDVFKPNQKLGNGKVNIVMAHWSDNKMKGEDVAEWLDNFCGEHSDEFTFTFIGRTKAKLKHSQHIGPFFGKKLGDELGKYDVCVSGSRFDPGPNHIAESISCQIPTYVHVDGGGCVEFAGADHVYRDFDELKTLLVNGQFTSNSTKFLGWSESIKQYADFLKSVYER